MKSSKRSFLKGGAALLTVGAMSPAFAFMPKLPGVGGGSGGSQVDPAKLKDQIRVALVSLVKANEQYLLALGHADAAAGAKLMSEKLGSGTLGADEVKGVTEIAETTIKSIKEASDKGTKLTAEAGAFAGQGLVEHVNGSVAGVQAGRSLKSALQSPSPTIVAALGPVKDFPSLLTTWTSATSTVFTYLSSNGIDTTKANAAISKAMQDD
jgi:hypothetical protein